MTMTKDDNPIIQEHDAPQRSGLPKEEVLALLRERVMQGGHPTVKQEYGSPQRGVETGLDEVFVVNRATYDALIKADAKSETLLKPFMQAAGMNRWRAEPSEHWLIHTVQGTVNIDDYPAIRDHLAPYRERLEKRNTGKKWFELSVAEHLVPKAVADLKLVFQEHLSWPGGYTLDQSGAYHASGGYHLSNGDYYIAGLLNSTLYWFLLGAISPPNHQGVIQVEAAHLEDLPVPRMVSVDLIATVGMFSDTCHRLANERHDLYNHVIGQIAAHLAPGKTASELSDVLRTWHILTTDNLQKESQRLFGKTFSEEEMHMWDAFLSEAKYELNRINMDMVQAEKRVNMAIYEMFEVTEEEIEYLEKFQ